MGAAVETIEEVFRTAIRRHQAGDIEGAAELYNQILREAPHHPGAWHLLGLVYFARRDFQAALLHIERALSYCDSKAVYWNNYGAVLKELGRIREAQLAFEKALAIHPGYADAWSNLGLVQWELGYSAEAEGALRHALQLRPGHADALRHLARVAQAKGDTQTAIRPRRSRPVLGSVCRNWLPKGKLLPHRRQRRVHGLGGGDG